MSADSKNLNIGLHKLQLKQTKAKLNDQSIKIQRMVEYISVLIALYRKHREIEISFVTNFAEILLDYLCPLFSVFIKLGGHTCKMT